MNSPALFAVVLACALPLSAAADTFRTWTTADGSGKPVIATFIGFDGTLVGLKLSTGQSVSVPITRLSEADQTFVKAQPAPGTVRTWPSDVEVSSSSIEVKLVKEDPGARKFSYQSEGFEYTSQGKLLPSLMKEVARTFEATKKLVGALPWGVTCRPPEGMEFYQAALFETRKDYIEAGGPSNSGGVYMTGEKIFKIPFESLGIKRLGKSYTKDENYRSDTLVHEITHQMMHDYLPYMPKWAIEGSAEYTEMLPYKAGHFSVIRNRDGLKGYLDEWRKRGRTPTVPSVKGIFRMKRMDWDDQSSSQSRQHELYQQSALLVYYFNHLEGDGSGGRWMKFMDVTKAEAAKWKNFEKDFKAYRAAMDEFFKLPGVKKLEDGRFSYPSGLTPPKAPEEPDGMKYGEDTSLKHLDVLIGERTDDDLQKDINTKYSKLGLKLTN